MFAASLIYLLWSTTGKGIKSSHSAKYERNSYDRIDPRQSIARGAEVQFFLRFELSPSFSQHFCNAVLEHLDTLTDLLDELRSDS